MRTAASPTMSANADSAQADAIGFGDDAVVVARRLIGALRHRRAHRRDRGLRPL